MKQISGMELTMERGATVGDMIRRLKVERDALREVLEHLAAQAEDSRCKPDGYVMAEYARAALTRI